MAVASHTVLVVTAGLLFWITAADLREFKIRNELILVLAGLFFLHAALSGRWLELHWNVAFAASMGGLMLLAYARGLMGGGDIKLLFVAFLWTGIHCVALFLLGLALISLLHAAAARCGWVEAQRDKDRMRIPFAPSVAAGLIAVFLFGCLAPKHASANEGPKQLWSVSRQADVNDIPLASSPICRQRGRIECLSSMLSYSAFVSDSFCDLLWAFPPAASAADDASHCGVFVHKNGDETYV